MTHSAASRVYARENATQRGNSGTAQAAALDKNVENLALVVDGTPEMHSLADDPHHHLVKRKEAAAFLDERRSNRYNKVYNALLDGWLAVLLGADRSVETTVSAYEGGTVAENPSFSIGSRTAYTRRLAS